MKKIFLCFCFLLLSACSSDDSVHKNEANSKFNNEYNLDEFTNTYVSNDLEFSINYPKTWNVTGYKEGDPLQIMERNLDGEEKTIEGKIHITFTNTPLNFESAYGVPEDYKAVNLWIYKVNSEKYDKAYNGEFLYALNHSERLNENEAEITKFKVGNKDVVLSVQETPDTFEAPSTIVSEAFYTGENYGYRFNESQGNYTNRNKEDTKLIIEEYLKPMLSTFKDLSV